MNKYPDCKIEDLEGDKSLLVVLPTNLAVDVLKSYCLRPFSLQCVPSLMKQCILPYQVRNQTLHMHDLQNI